MIQSLTRSMRILDYMAKTKKRDYSIAELSTAVDLPPSSVYRVLQTFVQDNYVLLDPKTHLYRLGPALIPLGRAAEGESDLPTLAMPFLQKIADQTGDDAFLMALSGYHSRTIAKAEGPRRIKIVDSFESNFDLHCGANRKMLLAFQSKEFIDEYIALGLTAHTPNTITDPDVLRRELDTIRREKISFSLSEFIEDAMGISAPVFDHSGAVIASMGTSGPAFQTSREKIDQHKAIISQCAAELSAVLGYTGE